MKTTRTTVRVFLLLACAAALAACASQTPVVTDGLNAAEVFQRAQDAVARGDYTAGIAYYSVVPKNFPDDKDHGAWASYEIAFLYHKMGKNDVALTLMKNLLDQYAQAPENTLPQGPEILAQKLKTKLEALAAAATAAAGTTAAGTTGTDTTAPAASTTTTTAGQ